MRYVRGTVRFIHSEPYVSEFLREGAPQEHRFQYGIKPGEFDTIDDIPILVNDCEPRERLEPSYEPSPGTLRTMARHGDSFGDAEE